MEIEKGDFTGKAEEAKRKGLRLCLVLKEKGDQHGEKGQLAHGK